MIPEALKLFREIHGLTQSQLGAIVGRSRATVANWESGGVQPDRAASRLLEELKSQPHKVAALASAKQPEPASDWESFREAIREYKPDPRVICDKEGDFKASVPPGFRASVNLDELAFVGGMDLSRKYGARSDPLVADGVMAAPVSPLGLADSLAQLGVSYIVSDWSKGDRLLPVLLTDPVPYWLEGDAPVPDSDLGIEVHRGRIKGLGAGMLISRTLLKLSNRETERAFAASLVRCLKRGLNRGALVGVGSEAEPQGLATHPNVTEVDAAGAFDADDWRLAIKTLELSGVDSERIGVVAHPAVKEKLSKLEFGGLGLWFDSECGGRPARVSADLDDGMMIIGAFDTLAIYHDSRVQVQMSMMPSSGGQLTQLFAFLDCAVLTGQPGAFLRIKNI